MKKKYFPLLPLFAVLTLFIKCKQNERKRVSPSVPFQNINTVQRTGMRDNFKLIYFAANNNIDTPSLEISLTKVKVATDFLNTTPSQGFVFAKYYVLVSPGGTENPYFSYVLTKALKNKNINGNDTIIPIPDAQGNYLLITKNNTNGQNINATQFQTMLANYRNTIKFKFNNQSFGVNNYFHPYVSYHDMGEFVAFYNHNKSLFTTESSVTIVLENAALEDILRIFPKIPSNPHIILQCHSPILLFKEIINENEHIYLDNISRGKNIYLKKGLDVGRLCPPQCY